MISPMDSPVSHVNEGGKLFTEQEKKKNQSYTNRTLTIYRGSRE